MGSCGEGYVDVSLEWEMGEKTLFGTKTMGRFLGFGWERLVWRPGAKWMLGTVGAGGWEFLSGSGER